MAEYDFDLLVIGAGSGGARAARTAAGLGVKVAIAEPQYLGGTCVNVGCVPKKLFSYAAQFSEEFRAAEGFGWTASGVKFDWTQLKSHKDREVQRLQGGYQGLLEQSGATIFTGAARILDTHTVAIEDKIFRCERILIATGGRAVVPDLPGKEWVLTSNDMFALEELPRSLLIVGGGYIAVEFASIMHGLGVKVTVCHHGDRLLRNFDEEIGLFLAGQLEQKGITLHFNTEIKRIVKAAAGLHAYDGNDQPIHADKILYATGRRAAIEGLGLETVGVALTEKGAIEVNEHFQTSVPSIFALGDVANRLNLTPVAIAEAMAFVNHYYTDRPRPVDYENVPTAVFSHPPVGTVGLTEAQAREKYPDIAVYKTTFTPLKHALSGLTEQTFVKLLVNKADDKVLGVHMVGADAPEIIQGMAIALRAGATKAIFDSTIGVHPTAAEELVTLRKPAA